MEIISINEIKVSFNYPFFYLKEFGLFNKETDGKEIIYFSDELNNTIACKIWVNKFLKIIQPIYPPLSNGGERLDKQYEYLFLNQWLSFVLKNKIAQRVVQPENFAIFKTVPKDTISAPFATYYLNLEKNTEQDLLKKLHPKHRNVIRHAEKNDIVLKYGQDCIGDFYKLYKQTMARSNMYCQDVSYFENFYNSMPQNIICGVAYHNNIPQGGIFIPFTKFGAFYLYGSSKEKIEINGAINYLHWNTIKLLKQQGVKRYDFVGARLSDVSGTKLEGIQQFKKRFGAELERGFLWKKDLVAFDCIIFDELVQFSYSLKKEKPLLDIIDEELLKEDAQRKNRFTLSQRIKIKIQEKSREVNKKIRTFKKEIKKSSLINDLSLAGILKGDTIMVHSSLSKIGNVNGGAQTVIAALLEQIGEEGNLVMPAYSYIDSMENTVQEKDYVFNPLINPSVVGKITEEFRKMHNVKRSAHPTHSVCAYGKMSDYITSGHLNGETNFGENSPFHRVRELKGKILGLGISIGPVTIYHSVEDFYPELFPDVYLPIPASVKMQVNGTEITKSIFVHNPTSHINRIDKNKLIENWLTSYLINKGILHTSSFGAGTMWWMDIQELFNEQIALKEKGISIYKAPKSE